MEETGWQAGVCKRLRMCNPKGCSWDKIQDEFCVCFIEENQEIF